MCNKLTLVFRSRHLMKKTMDDKHIQDPRCWALTCLNRYFYMKKKWFYTIPAVMRLVVRISNNKQVLVGCLGEFGRLVIRIMSNLYSVRPTFAIIISLSAFISQAFCQISSSFLVQSTLLRKYLHGEQLFVDRCNSHRTGYNKIWL